MAEPKKKPTSTGQSSDMKSQSKKGILKKEKSKTSDQDDNTNRKKSLRWDEMNVTATLHPVGKDYGFMKINEAPTPHPGTSARLDKDQLTERLEKLDEEQRQESDWKQKSLDEEKRRREMFLKKRKEHYDEFKIAKQMSCELIDSEEDED